MKPFRKYILLRPALGNLANIGKDNGLVQYRQGLFVYGMIDGIELSQGSTCKISSKEFSDDDEKLCRKYLASLGRERYMR